MEYLLNEIPTWIITALVAFISMGISWGFFKSEVSHLKEADKEKARRLENLETAKTNMVFKMDCGTFREQCQGNIEKEFSFIKSAIDKNREIVLSRFDEFKEFMGYVKRVVEDFDARNNGTK
jgi:hypothetical protein